MASNLTIGYAEIPRKASALTATPAAATGHLETATILGGRRTYWKSGTAGASQILKFDLGAGVTKGCDFLFIARADMLTKADATSTVTLFSSADDSSYMSRIASSPIASADMAGFRSDDYLKTCTLTSAYRYWQVVFSNVAVGSVLPACSKIMFGTRFDFGRDPIWGRSVKAETNQRGQRDSKTIFELSWEGVTAAKLAEFETEIVEYQDVQSLCLIAESYSDILLDARAVHVRLSDWRAKPINVSNFAIDATFEELI